MYLYAKTKNNGIDVYEIIKDEQAISNYKYKKVNQLISEDKKMFFTYKTECFEHMQYVRYAESLNMKDYCGPNGDFDGYCYRDLCTSVGDLVQEYANKRYDRTNEPDIVKPRFKKLVSSGSNQILGGIVIGEDEQEYDYEEENYVLNRMLYISKEQMILHFLEIGDFTSAINYDWKEQLPFFDFQLRKSLSVADVKELKELELLNFDVLNSTSDGAKVLRKVVRTLHEW